MINSGVREIEVRSLDGGEDGEKNGIGFVEISRIFCNAEVFSLEQKRLAE